MVRVRMVIEGNVQGVGYRALVKQVARRMKIKGKVKNLEDGTVEVYCEADKATVDAFAEKINIKAKDPEDVFGLNVENIKLYREGQEGYIPPPMGLGIFDIDYDGEATSTFEKSSLERLEMGSLILSDSRKIALDSREIALDSKAIALDLKTIALDSKEIALDSKEIALDSKEIASDSKTIALESREIALDSRTIALDSKEIALDSRKILSDFKEETKENFHVLGEKYHTVSKELKSINKNIAKLSGSMERIGAVVIKAFGKKKRK